jgi:hypothetical protein
VVDPFPIFHRSLTGRVRPRRTWYGRVVLQVEVLCERLDLVSLLTDREPRVISTSTEWRDARINDQLEQVYAGRRCAVGGAA